MSSSLRKNLYFHHFLLAFFTLILSFNFTMCLGQSAYELAINMFAETKDLNSLSYTMGKKERINGELILQVTSVKLSIDPLKVYTIQQSPKKGLEVLYCEGENENKAYIHPSGFPWFTLRLDPMGSMMRNKQHHTILNSGYDLVISILEFLFNKYGEETKKMMKKLPSENWSGIPCEIIEFNNPYFKYIKYKVREGETLLTIADSLKISEYMILEKNEDIDDYDDVKPGQVIEMPNDYCPRMAIYIDKSRSIPLMMKIYDEKGVFEIYEYYDVIVNPSFKSEEFSSDYHEYGF